MCVLRADPLFVKAVCDKLVKSLKDQVLAWHAMGPPVPGKDGPFDVAYHGYLAKYIKNWGELHMFVEGSTSEFYNAFEELNKAGVNFAADVPVPVPPPAPAAAAAPRRDERYHAPAAPARPAQGHHKHRVANPEAEAAEIITFASQLPPETWTTDKDIVRQVYTSVKSLNEGITLSITESDQNPEVDLSALLNLNSILNNLEDLIVKASKGDQPAILEITQFSSKNPVPGQKPAAPGASTRLCSSMYDRTGSGRARREACCVCPRRPAGPRFQEAYYSPSSHVRVAPPAQGGDGTEAVAYMQGEVEKLAKRNSELVHENTDLRKRLETLQLSKSHPAGGEPRLNTSSIYLDVVDLSLSNISREERKSPAKVSPSRPPVVSVAPLQPAPPVLAAPVPIPVPLTVPISVPVVVPPKPVEAPKGGENAKLFKECLLASGGPLYTDKSLQIAVIRSVDGSTKAAVLKLNFFNKGAEPVTVENFQPATYNKGGNVSGHDVGSAKHNVDAGVPHEDRAGRTGFGGHQGHAQALSHRGHYLPSRIRVQRDQQKWVGWPERKPASIPGSGYPWTC